MKKVVIALVVALVLTGLAFPIANLIAKPDNSDRLTGLGPDADPVMASLRKKCVVCHTPGAALPFYADFPIAKSQIRGNVERGLRYLDWQNQAVNSEVGLAKLEHVVESDSMPPRSYRLMHWDAALSGREKSAILTWVRRVRTERYASGTASPGRAAWAVQPLTLPEDPDPDLVALGKSLYRDTRLSGDGTVSCATCHGLDTGGVDRLRFSKKVGGQVGGINAPTVYNSGLSFAQCWDGRAADLVDQVGRSVESPGEMAARWPDVIQRLEGDAAFLAAFQKHYGGELSRHNVRDALAYFVGTLITTGSRFDAWLMGDAPALSEKEKQGYYVFRRHACATCHVGKILGGQSFERMGRAHDYFADRGDPIEADAGRYNATRNEEDRHKFKVPTLRNVATTYPYFHDGSTSDLTEAVQTMAKYQNGEPLGAQDADRIVAFLKSLTGEYDGKQLE